MDLVRQPTLRSLFALLPFSPVLFFSLFAVPRSWVLAKRRQLIDKGIDHGCVIHRKYVFTIFCSNSMLKKIFFGRFFSLESPFFILFLFFFGCRKSRGEVSQREEERSPIGEAEESIPLLGSPPGYQISLSLYIYFLL